MYMSNESAIRLLDDNKTITIRFGDRLNRKYITVKEYLLSFYENNFIESITYLSYNTNEVLEVSFEETIFIEKII